MIETYILNQLIVKNKIRYTHTTTQITILQNTKPFSRTEHKKDDKPPIEGLKEEAKQ